MRLITYDRGGARRLGAWVGETVVDLPEAVGHPAFPATMEALVQRSGGSILEAARDILTDQELVAECTVKRARLLVPYVSATAPLSVLNGRHAGEADDDHPSVSAGLACILRGNRRALNRHNGMPTVFGYTLAIQWTNPYRGETTTWLGPAVATAEGFERKECRLQVSIDGDLCYDEPIADLQAAFGSVLQEAAGVQSAGAGDVVTWMRWHVRSNQALEGRIPAVVEVAAEPVGVLRAQTPAWMRSGS